MRPPCPWETVLLNEFTALVNHPGQGSRVRPSGSSERGGCSPGVLDYTPQDRSSVLRNATPGRGVRDLREFFDEMSRPPSWPRGAGETGCLEFLQNVPWGATPEKMREYVTWLMANGADS